MWRFVWLFIKRDLKGCRGGPSSEDALFQSYLPILGTLLVLTILCAVSLLLLGFYQGYQTHLVTLNDDPFSSAITLEGKFHKELHWPDFSRLVWHTKERKFAHVPNGNPLSADHRKVVRDGVGSPLRLRGFSFVNRHGFFISTDPFYGNTVQTSDRLTRAAVIQSFVVPGSYFASDNDHGLIITQSLYESLGYSVESEMPRSLRVLAPNEDHPPEKHIKDQPEGRAMTSAEQATYTIALPLRGVARNLPNGSFLMTEGL